MKLILVFLPLLIIFAASNAKADWTDQFIGSVNFRLSDDPDYTRAANEVNSASAGLTTARNEMDIRKRHLDQAAQNRHAKNAELQRVKQAIESKKKQLIDNESSIASLTGQLVSLQSEVNSLSDQVESLRGRLSQLGKKQSDLQAQLAAATDPTVQEDLKRKILAVQSEISSTQGEVKSVSLDLRTKEAQVQANTNKIAELKATSTSINAELPGLQASISRLTSEAQQAAQVEQSCVAAVQQQMKVVSNYEALYNREINQFESVKNQLINEILSLNRQGYDRSSNDGAREGMDIAQRVGINAGQTDGNYNGHTKGEADGRSRDYDIGVRQGDVKGSADGARDGQKVGNVDGIVDGNKEAGRIAGSANGVRRAEASDARKVGDAQGIKAGFESAVQDGKENGYELGEAEAIQNNEATPISDKVIQGQFAGTFDGSIPGFPGAQGTYFNSNSNIGRYVVRQAYIAGYNYGYNPSAERTFYNNIRGIYDQAYNSAYNWAYQDAYNKQYEDSRQQGEARQYKIAYDREYNRAYNSAYEHSFGITVNQPNVQGADYQNSYKSADASAYAAHYEELRKASFDIAFKISYDKNIGEQTAKYKAERISQIDALYRNFPVIDYVSEAIWDAGTKKVGVRDGIYMPGEDVAHDVVITNYGSAMATGIELRIDEANSVVIPSIPGKTRLTINGAALHRLNANLQIGANSTSKLVARFVLASPDKGVQGHHFASIDDNIVARAQAITVKAQYPVSASNPVAKTAVFIHQPVKLKMSMNNISRKPLNSLTLKIDTTLGTSVVSNEFSNVGILENSTTLEDAEVTIKAESDLFSTISFKVSIYSNGVLVGNSIMGGEEIVRAGYEEKPGKPVVVFSSLTKEGRDDFKDLMSESEGMSNISIIDLNGQSQNTQVLSSKMAGKTLLVALDKEGKVLAALENVFKNDHVFVAFLNGTDATLAQARNNLKTVKDSTILPFEYKDHKLSILSTAPLLNQEVKSKASIVSFEIRDLDLVHVLAKALKQNDDELLSTLGAAFTMEDFLAKSDDMLLFNKVIGLRAIEDVVQISTAFELSDDRKERRELRKMFKKEEDLLLRKFRAKLEKGSKQERLATSAAAYPLQHGLDFLLNEREPFLALAPRIQRNALRSIKDFDNEARRFIKRNLSRDTVKKIEAIETAYFVIP
ncbi:MAG: hypothetical protein ACOYL6_10590 [Bacteriovoracaceae bacterium]